MCALYAKAKVILLTYYGRIGGSTGKCETQEFGWASKIAQPQNPTQHSIGRSALLTEASYQELHTEQPEDIAYPASAIW